MSPIVRGLLAWNASLQTLGVLAALAGIACSAWLAHEAWLDARAVRANGPIEQVVARSHLRSQIVVLLVQVSFGMISLLVLGLPPLPAEMETAIHGEYVLGVIAFRKLARLCMIIGLAGAAWRQAVDRRTVLGLLAQERQGRA